MHRIPFISLTTLLLCSCATPQHNSSPMQPEKTAAPSNATPLPYPEPDLHSQIEQLHLNIGRLENQIEQLQSRIAQLEQRPAATRTRVPQNRSRNRSVAAHKPPPQPDSLLTQAENAYHQGRHQDVVQLLAAADNGGSGSETDRRKMQLLLQSQQHLDNCQSVIVIGQRYAILFGSKSGAADALYSVGQCQWQIQQRDIAADTWRKLIRTYPDSQAAKRASTRLKL